MEHEFKVDEVCIYKGNYNQKETLVRVVTVRKDEEGWTHKVQIMGEQPQNRYWIHPRNLTPIGENSDLINSLDSVGLF